MPIGALAASAESQLLHLVCLQNLPAGWSNQDLMLLFQQFGAVQECRVLHAGDTARGAGALVRMGSVSEAAAAIERLNGNSMGGSAPLLVRCGHCLCD